MRQPAVHTAIAMISLTMALALVAGCSDDDSNSPPATPTATSTAVLPSTSTPTPPATTMPPSSSTPEPSSTPTRTASTTFTPTPQPTTTPTLQPSRTATAAPTSTETDTATPSPTPTASPTITFTPIVLPDGLHVGIAKRDISPTLETAPPDGQVFLGGYGFGPGRRSTGLLAPIYVRAFVISDGTSVVAFAENETQGQFGAYKQGPYGLIDIAADIEMATGGVLPRTHIMIGSDHSHAGPDTTGVWGGLRPAYLQYLKTQTIGAILDALASLQPAALSVGKVNAGSLLHSQFDKPPNDVVNEELRVLVAATPEDPNDLLGVLINYAAHSTVMGSENTLVSGDWPSVVATQVETALGIDTAVVMLADCGRTQPSRPSVDGTTEPEKLTAYANDVTARVLEAVDLRAPANTGAVQSTQLFVRDRFDNSVIGTISFLANIISRKNAPPWLDGEVVGTVVSAARVGDLFFAGIPGEGYPAIQFGVEAAVPAQEHFVFGLANDQLGYLIAPEEGYADVRAAAPENDNAVFNVSPGIGDHVMCTLFKGARATGWTLPQDPARCSRWADEDNTLPF